MIYLTTNKLREIFEVPTVSSPQSLFRSGFQQNHLMFSAGSTQVKLQFAYPIWYDFKLALAYQNNPGLAQAATLGYTNAQVAPSLGRNLSTASVAVVSLLAPNTLFEPRYNQFDVRLSRRFQIGRVRFEPRADVYNLFNSVTALGSISGYGAAWLRPTDALGARLAKFGVQLDF